MSYTPSPWKFDGWQRVRPVEGNQDGVNDICHVYEQGGRCSSNGRLIAAAPELLESICELVELVETCDDASDPSTDLYVAVRVAKLTIAAAVKTEKEEKR
jgi:hypothetical protein